MNQSDFKTWIQKHRSAFTGIGAWLKRASDDADVTPKAILDAWQETLRNVELDDALEATRLMHSGDESEPKGYDRHPAAIRAIAKRLAGAKAGRECKPRLIDGHETVTCLRCADYGSIEVWHPRSMHAARQSVRVEAGEEKSGPTLGEPFTIYTCSVPCTCAAGDRFAAQQRHDYRYDEKTMLPYRPRADRSERQELVDWIRSRMATVKPTEWNPTVSYEQAIASHEEV